MKLALTKVYQGRYKVETESHLVRVEQNDISKTWFGVVEIKTHIAQDVEGNNVQMTDELFTWSANTKKEVSEVLAGWVSINL